MKRNLYICDQSPFESSNGGQQRSGLLLKALCEKANVDIVCFTSVPLTLKNAGTNYSIKFYGSLAIKTHKKIIIRIKRLFNIFLSLSPYSVYGKNKDAYNITYDLLKSNKYDHIVIRYIRNAFLCGLYNDKRIIVDVDDIPEQSILSYAEFIKMSKIKYFQYLFYAKRAKFHTNKFIKKIDHCFVSNKDQCFWENSSYLPNIPYWKNQSQTNDISSIENNHVVLFVGYMEHSPNVQGVRYFIENIWMKIKHHIPDAIFRIAGKGVTAEQKNSWENYEGVKVLGYVPDINCEYEHCKVVVAPIYYGAGTNIKILEAMSLQRACVISDYAAIPFKNDLVDKQNILIAHNNEDFSIKVLQLLTDEKLYAFITANAAKVINEKYTYAVFSDCVNQYLN